MSFNGITAYGDFLPSSQYSNILLNAFYLYEPDYDGEVYLIRNGQSSYLLMYNVVPYYEHEYSYIDYIQYYSPSGYSGRYTFEFGDGRQVFFSDWVPQYIYQGSDDLMAGNVILAEGYAQHQSEQKIENLLSVSSILIAAFLLFSCFVQFFRKIIF